MKRGTGGELALFPRGQDFDFESSNVQVGFLQASSVSMPPNSSHKLNNSSLGTVSSGRWKRGLKIRACEHTLAHPSPSTHKELDYYALGNLLHIPKFACDFKYNNQAQNWEGFSQLLLLRESVNQYSLKIELQSVWEIRLFITGPKWAYFSLSQVPAFLLTSVQEPPVYSVCQPKKPEWERMPSRRDRAEQQVWLSPPDKDTGWRRWARSNVSGQQKQGVTVRVITTTYSPCRGDDYQLPDTESAFQSLSWVCNPVLHFYGDILVSYLIFNLQFLLYLGGERRQNSTLKKHQHQDDVGLRSLVQVMPQVSTAHILTSKAFLYSLSPPGLLGCSLRKISRVEMEVQTEKV